MEIINKTVNMEDVVTEDICPICLGASGAEPVASTLFQVAICSDCDNLLGLGFSNFDEQPGPEFYPATWVYDRMSEIAGLSFGEGKRRWLYEAADDLKALIASGDEAVKEYERRRRKSPEQVLDEIRQNIRHIELMLK